MKGRLRLRKLRRGIQDTSAMRAGVLGTDTAGKAQGGPDPGLAWIPERPRVRGSTQVLNPRLTKRRFLSLSQSQLKMTGMLVPLG